MKLTVSIENEGVHTLVSLSGPIDESVNDSLLPLLKIPNGLCIFDLSKVTSINSLGIRSWIIFMRAFRDTHEIIFRKCPTDIVMQINAIPAFSGDAKVESVLASFFCDKCQTSILREFATNRPMSDLLKEYSAQTCDVCKSRLEGDDPTDVFPIQM